MPHYITGAIRSASDGVPCIVCRNKANTEYADRWRKMMGSACSARRSVAGAMVTRVLDTGGMRLRGVIRSLSAYPIVVFHRHLYTYSYIYKHIDIDEI